MDMNTNQFSVGQFHVDMRRSQIINQNAIVSMEPKVLKVLLVLAEHQGKVVTQKDLLDKVWPNIEVAPNTLQRCITQLRKALDDNAREQRVIATHPRVGYSLLASVNWPAETPLVNIQDEVAAKTLSRFAKLAIMFSVVLIAISAYLFYLI